jgi:hypothetical protein
MFLFKNSNFNKKLDLLPWVQKNLLPSKIKESTCEREEELKSKFKKKSASNRKKFGELKKKKKLERERNSKEEEEEE